METVLFEYTIEGLRERCDGKYMFLDHWGLRIGVLPTQVLKENYVSVRGAVREHGCQVDKSFCGVRRLGSFSDCVRDILENCSPGDLVAGSTGPRSHRTQGDPKADSDRATAD